MAPPSPYVNPLTAEQIEALRISEICFEHLTDGSIDALETAKAVALVRAHLIEKLGPQFAPGKGNAALKVKLQLLFSKNRPCWTRTGQVQLKLDVKIVGPDIAAEYSAGTSHQAVHPTSPTRHPPR